MSNPLPSLKRVAGVAVLAACSAFAAQAEEFSWQLSGGVLEAETSGFDRDTWAVDATFYVNSLDDSAGPYALASFLNPTTRVSAAANRSDSPASTGEPTAYTLSGAYVLPGKKWYVGASYAESDVDNDETGLSASDPKGYGIRAGRYLGTSTTVELALGRAEQESVIACVGLAVCAAGAARYVHVTNDTVSLEVFHLRRFRSLTYALQGRVSEQSADIDITDTSLIPLATFAAPSPSPSDVRSYAVAAELFPTRTLGVRIGYSRPGSHFDIDTYDVGATWFFKPRVAAQLALSMAKRDDGPPGFRRFDSTAVRFIGRL